MQPFYPSRVAPPCEERSEADLAAVMDTAALTTQQYGKIFLSQPSTATTIASIHNTIQSSTGMTT